MATRPLVMPETFSGQEQDWSEWIDHFENVAMVNGWDTDAVKLKWLKVRLTGKAQTAFKKFTEAERTSYEAALKKLKNRFEPKSRREIYLAELPLKKKKHAESWGDFADDLSTLVDRAYPDLGAEAQEQLALTYYMAQVTNPQVAFGVKQSRPKTMNDAVTATMEMEAFLPGAGVTGPKSLRGVSSMDVRTDEQDTEQAASIQNSCPQPRWAQGLTDRLDKLEQNMQQLALQRQPGPRRHPTPSSRPRRNQPKPGRPRGEVKCWNCGKTGHYARGCAEQSIPSDQGN